MTFFILLILSAIIYFRIPPHWSILFGVLVSVILPNSELFQKNGKAWSTRLLQISVILLGASLNFQSVIREGANGIILTFFSISSILVIGKLLARIFQIPSPLSSLIAVGTSICGGSAISTIAPILRASNITIATALGIIFILNGG